MRCGCRCAPTGSRFIRSSKRPDCPRWLSNLMESIDRGIVQRLHGPPGPADLDPVDLAHVAETEVHDAARLRQVAAAGLTCRTITVFPTQSRTTAPIASRLLLVPVSRNS